MKMIGLSLISKYRSELMGLAILYIIYSHIPYPFSYWPLCVTQWNGHFGVDMFLVMSGMGLVFSINKNSSTHVFLLKRAIRIFPVYTITNLLYLIKPFITHTHGFNLLDLLFTCTTVGYWLDLGFCDWFIPHIVVMYILFPIIWRLTRNVNPLYCILLVFLIWSMLSSVSLEDTQFYRASYRYLDFLLGIFVGKIILENKATQLKISTVSFSIAMIIGVLLASYYHYIYATNVGFWACNQLFYQRGYVYSPYVFIVVGALLLFSCLLFFTNNLRVLGGAFLKFTGKMSIELYLIHVWLLNTYFHPSVWGLLAFIIESYILAYLLHKINVKIMNCLLIRLK